MIFSILLRCELNTRNDEYKGMQKYEPVNGQIVIVDVDDHFYEGHRIFAFIFWSADSIQMCIRGSIFGWTAAKIRNFQKLSGKRHRKIASHNKRFTGTRIKINTHYKGATKATLYPIWRM